MFRTGLMAALGVTAALTAGCAKLYTEQADREVYGIVSEKSQKEFSRSPAFTIQPSPASKSF